MQYRVIEETGSTNTYLKQKVGEDAAWEAPLMLRAVRQTAGRGQRGNSWESAPGRNLTFSILWRSADVAPREQFCISEAVALGLVDWLAEKGIEGKVKWPNDIYVGDRKICGILIEHTLSGEGIERSILGIGVNVNQEEFISDAPNPVSLHQLTSRYYDLEEEEKRIGSALERRLLSIEDKEERGRMHEEFLGKLWRGDGKPYIFKDIKGGREFEGIIRDVEPEGMIVIEGEGEIKRYAFKEVAYKL